MPQFELLETMKRTQYALQENITVAITNSQSQSDSLAKCQCSAGFGEGLKNWGLDLSPFNVSVVE
jgi:acetone carboxylase gamma subunit